MTANVRIRQGALALLAGALLLAAQTAAAQSGPLRIVVLPFYTEEGTDVTDAGYEARHYQRIIRFINNQLVRHGFEVISSHATELKEAEYNRLRERTREDSSLAAREMTRKYAVDVAYVVWLDVSRRTTGDGYCRVKARVEGEGYDSGGRDIGAGVIKTFTWTRADCDDAVIEAEKEVGGEVGRTLAAWRGRSAGGDAVTGGTTGSGGEGGVVQRETEALGSLINVRSAAGTVENVLPNGSYYVGGLRDGEPHGQGFQIWPDGDRYEGEYRDGTYHGQGVYTWPDGQRYEGEFRNDEYHGQGVMTYPDGRRYEGEFRDDEFHGQGVMTYPDGRRYESEFRNGEVYAGQGVYTWPNGQRYEGEFRDDKFHGQGVYTYPSGTRYEGEFRDGDFHGQGVYTHPNGRRYEGEFRDDDFNGQGVMTYPSGTRYEGEFRDDEFHGQGVYTWPDGTRFKGEFREGKMQFREGELQESE